MGSLKQSFAWWSFVRGDADPVRIVREAARIGYAGVDFAPEEHWPLLRDHGLEIVAIGGHRSLTEGLNRRDLHTAIADEIAASLDKAVAQGIPNLIVFAGNRVPGVSEAAAAAITAEGLQRVAPLAEQAGVTLVLELLNSRVDHTGYQADHTAWGVAVCEQVGSPRVRLLYDVYHMQIMEGDIIATIRAQGGWFGHYHTGGVPGRHEIGDDQELNYRAIVCAICATGYDGFIAHEFLPTGDTVAALEEAFRIGEG